MHESINTLSEVVYEKRMALEVLGNERNGLLNKLCEKQEKINRTEDQINRLVSELKQLSEITYGGKMQAGCGDRDSGLSNSAIANKRTSDPSKD